MQERLKRRKWLELNKKWNDEWMTSLSIVRMKVLSKMISQRLDFGYSWLTFQFHAKPAQSGNTPASFDFDPFGSEPFEPFPVMSNPVPAKSTVPAVSSTPFDPFESTPTPGDISQCASLTWRSSYEQCFLWKQEETNWITDGYLCAHAIYVSHSNTTNACCSTKQAKSLGHRQCATTWRQSILSSEPTSLSNANRSTTEFSGLVQPISSGNPFCSSVHWLSQQTPTSQPNNRNPFS